MSNYDVLVQPDDRYWYVQVPAIERSTQAKGLDDIEPMAKDLITVMNDDDNPELKVTFCLLYTSARLPTRRAWPCRKAEIQW